MEIISPWMLYLWTRLDVLNIVLGALSILGLCSTILYPPIIHDCVGVPDQKFHYKVWKYITTITLFSLLVFILLPSKKDAALIYVVTKIVNNPTIQQEAGKVYGEFGELYTIAKEALIESLPKKEKAEEK